MVVAGREPTAGAGVAVRGFDDASMREEAANASMFHFDRKHVYSFKNNVMCGITFGQWWQIVSKQWRHFDWCYVPRAMFLTILSLFNSLMGLVEGVVYPDAMINQVDLPTDPVFIVGHPRTGTTLLHNLLASDVTNFYTCTTFCTGFPSCFLWFEGLGKRLFAGAIDPTRPMDSMPLHFDLPQEDECATLLLSCGASYYMPIYLMTREPSFRRFLDFSSEDGGTPEDEATWTSAFLYLLRKLTLRHQLRSKSSGLNHRLVLKSPIHAARVPLLRKLFPHARFIYMHRDPFETMASAAHLANTAFWFMYLSTPTDEQVNEYLFWQFDQMWRKYNSAAAVAPSQRSQVKRMIHDDILEVSYAQLTTHPSETLQKIYDHANVAWTSDTSKHFAAEVAALQSYQVNRHRTLPAPLRERIQSMAQEYMDALGYADPPASS
ncbi:hypothetical protein H310_07380 [Aphanomyces invadans]|uniref:Sulfotransferase domain-containing protein n=1 Tax=Aphanomyces invadans TaxID=157072 RepID=A0A024U3N4_9STRA|nr:hypothetical protein H310_07380 [Aphanomyces invadans]ETW00854.1 hypothetical protein H310_07380 [Aphanomyces invadans]|eukprot:XP_008870989.1 hypothetical protein H310_07380 [Aphanomyces invadans]